MEGLTAHHSFSQRVKPVSLAKRYVPEYNFLISQQQKIEWLSKHMLGLSQSIRNKKKKDSSVEMKEEERKKIEIYCQNVAQKNVLNVTIVRGLTIVTFSIYIDLLVRNSFQLSVLEISPIQVFSSSMLSISTASFTKIGQYSLGKTSHLSKPTISLKLAHFLFSISTMRKHQTAA